MAKPHPSPCPHVFNDAHPISWRAHTKCWHIWSKSLTMMPRHTYIHTYIHSYEPKYILKWVSGSIRFKHFSEFFVALSLYMPLGRGVAERDSANVTPKVKLCIHTMFNVCYFKGLSGQSIIFGLFSAWHEHRNSCGHIHVLKKHSPDYIDC